MPLWLFFMVVVPCVISVLLLFGQSIADKIRDYSSAGLRDCRANRAAPYAAS